MEHGFCPLVEKLSRRSVATSSSRIHQQRKKSSVYGGIMSVVWGKTITALLLSSAALGQSFEIKPTHTPDDRSLAEIQYSIPPAKHSNWKFWTLTAAQAAITAYDAQITAHNGREMSSPWLYGTWPARHPNKVYAVMGAEFGVSVLAGWALRHHHKALWFAPQGVEITTHTYGVIKSLTYRDTVTKVGGGK
jgi:hypothetical protein